MLKDIAIIHWNDRRLHGIEKSDGKLVLVNVCFKASFINEEADYSHDHILVI